MSAITENVFQRDCASGGKLIARDFIGSPQSLFRFVGFLELCTVADKNSVPSVNSKKYSPDFWLLTRIWFTKQSKQKHIKAKFAVELLWLPHYSFLSLQTDRHSGSYFSTTLRRKSLAIFSLLAHLSFSLSTHFLPCTCFLYFFSFIPAKTFVFRVS